MVANCNLQYFQLESFRHPLPQNCILIHLCDGIYTSFTDLPLGDIAITPILSKKTSHVTQPTSSFDALMRLSNLDNCIQDALVTRRKLVSQINSMLEQQKEKRLVIEEAERAKETLAATNHSLALCRRQVQNVEARKAELQSSQKARRDAIEQGRIQQDEARTCMSASSASLSTITTKSATTKAEVLGQIRRVCEDILRIYPIEPSGPRPLSYTIRKIQLPDVTATGLDLGTDLESTAAGLGLVAHVVELLSLYLSTPLPYPPSPRGSTSTIYDPVSTSMPSKAARIFPLYQIGAVMYRFEYGVFLLNSDIELLMNRQGAKVVDLRHTLPNLKYVLTVLTDGKGEIPGRKKGDIRALDGSVLKGLKISDDDEKRRLHKRKTASQDLS